MLEIMKKAAATQTIVGPVGVSKLYEKLIPTKTETKPTQPLKNNICSGVLEKNRILAGGIINKEIMSNTPTILMETPTTMASVKFKIVCSNLGLISQTEARSSFNVLVSKDVQRQ